MVSLHTPQSTPEGRFAEAPAGPPMGAECELQVVTKPGSLYWSPGFTFVTRRSYFVCLFGERNVFGFCWLCRSAFGELLLPCRKFDGNVFLLVPFLFFLRRCLTSAGFVFFWLDTFALESFTGGGT